MASCPGGKSDFRGYNSNEPGTCPRDAAPCWRTGDVQRIAKYSRLETVVKSKAEDCSLPQLKGAKSYNRLVGAETVAIRALAHSTETPMLQTLHCVYYIKSLGSRKVCCWSKRHGHSAHSQSRD